VRRFVKIHGQRGHWLAEVEGRWLAVLHNSFRDTRTGIYRASISPEHPGQKRFEALVAALADNDLVVMQIDKDRHSLARKGYAGVYRFLDLRVDLDDEMTLSLKITEKYAEPR
jgi:hypothetical protein